MHICNGASNNVQKYINKQTSFFADFRFSISTLIGDDSAFLKNNKEWGKRSYCLNCQAINHLRQGQKLTFPSWPSSLKFGSPRPRSMSALFVSVLWEFDAQPWMHFKQMHRNVYVCMYARCLTNACVGISMRVYTCASMLV